MLGVRLWKIHSSNFTFTVFANQYKTHRQKRTSHHNVCFQRPTPQRRQPNKGNALCTPGNLRIKCSAGHSMGWINILPAHRVPFFARNATSERKQGKTGQLAKDTMH